MARIKKSLTVNQSIRFSPEEIDALKGLAEYRGLPLHRMLRKAVLALIDLDDRRVSTHE